MMPARYRERIFFMIDESGSSAATAGLIKAYDRMPTLE